MNTQLNDGGPAFPVPATEFNERYSGMSLRDVFAAAALQGIIINRDLFFEQSNEEAAKCAYEAADAMIEARERKEES